jgi:hypothetical protein
MTHQSFIYLKELKSGSQRDTNILMFITALFMLTKMWKQLKCPSMEKWFLKTVFTQVALLLSYKEENPVIYKNMNES